MEQASVEVKDTSGVMRGVPRDVGDVAGLAQESLEMLMMYSYPRS
jgi:hypothetical protein